MKEKTASLYIFLDVVKYVICTNSELLGGIYMKGKVVLTIGFAGALAFSIGFAKDLQSTKEFSQIEQSIGKAKQTAIDNGDLYRIISAEEQNRREGKVDEGKNVTTKISVEEQNMVENSSVQQGFVVQENGTGFFFTKVE